MINTILFDLDGTLLSMDTDLFIKQYFGYVAEALKDHMSKEDVVKHFWHSTNEVIQSNDGSKTNEEVFFESFFSNVNVKKEDILPILNDFYANGFKKLSSLASSQKEMIDAIEILKDKGYKLVIATNPIFPELAIEERISWAKLNLEDFAYVTVFEKSHFTKPNINYYHEILEKINREASECLMVGNHLDEDMISKEIGINTYLITNHQMGDESNLKNADHKGDYQSFLEYIKSLPSLV